MTVSPAEIFAAFDKIFNHPTGERHMDNVNTAEIAITGNNPTVKIEVSTLNSIEAVKNLIATVRASVESAPVEINKDEAFAELDELEKSATIKTEKAVKLYEKKKSALLRTMGIIDTDLPFNRLQELAAHQKVQANTTRTICDTIEDMSRSLAAMKKMQSDFASKLTDVTKVAVNLQNAERGQLLALDAIRADYEKITSFERATFTPFMWPKYTTQDLAALVPTIDEELTDEAKFAKRVDAIMSDANPRARFDAICQIACELVKSLVSLRSKRVGLDKKIKDKSGCSPAEIETAKTMLCAFDKNIAAQKRKLDLIHRVHNASCSALVKFATAANSKFVEKVREEGMALKPIAVDGI